MLSESPNDFLLLLVVVDKRSYTRRTMEGDVHFFSVKIQGSRRDSHTCGRILSSTQCTLQIKSLSPVETIVKDFPGQHWLWG